MKHPAGHLIRLQLVFVIFLLEYLSTACTTLLTLQRVINISHSSPHHRLLALTGNRTALCATCVIAFVFVAVFYFSPSGILAR